MHPSDSKYENSSLPIFTELLVGPAIPGKVSAPLSPPASTTRPSPDLERVHLPGPLPNSSTQSGQPFLLRNPVVSPWHSCHSESFSWRGHRYTWPPLTASLRNLLLASVATSLSRVTDPSEGYQKQGSLSLRRSTENQEPHHGPRSPEAHGANKRFKLELCEKTLISLRDLNQSPKP